MLEVILKNGTVFNVDAEIAVLVSAIQSPPVFQDGVAGIRFLEYPDGKGGVGGIIAVAEIAAIRAAW